MRPLPLLMAVATLHAIAIAQPITTFPYSENFDGFATCGTSPTTVCPLSGGWTNPSGTGDQADWLPDCCGTGSSGTGPDGDAPSHGAGQYLYFETSTPAALGWEAWLLSPDFDISASPGVAFQFWYHAAGADCAELRADVWDPVGLTYNTVWQVFGPQQTSTSDPWLQTPPLALPSTGVTHVRIVAVRGASFSGDAAVDLFEVADFSAPSMGVDSIDAPSAQCAASASEVISVTYTNYSTTPAAMVPIQYTVSGPVSSGPVVEMIPMAAATSTNTFDFATTADFSIPGMYTIDVTVMIPGDTNPADDTASAMVTNPGGSPTLPIFEDWETGPNGWTVQGTSTFALGTPAKAVIIGAPPSGGVNSWVTGLTGLYMAGENGWVESPDFSFVGFTLPEVVLDVWWESEFSWDGAVLQSSTDAGATWQNIGAFGDPNNWYTDNTINGNPGGQQEGWTGRNGTGSPGWVVASHDAPALIGQPAARLRIAFGSDTSVQDDGFAFDNLIVREAGLMTVYDTGASSPAQPVQSSNGATDVVAVQFLVRADCGTDVLRGFDLTAAGSGDDMLDVVNVTVWLEDPSTTNGVVDPATDVPVFMGTYPADDGTIQVTFPPITLASFVENNFLVAYDFTSTAAGATPPATFGVTVSNLLVYGNLSAPAMDPTGTIEVSPCFTTLCGDCNLDGFTNILDALSAAQNAAAIITIPPMTPQFSNCNVQGLVEPDPGASVDILDALNIAQFAASLPTPLICC